MANYRGKKWLDGATYINERTRGLVAYEMAECIRRGHKSVGVRPGSYIGNPSPKVCITGNGGATLLVMIYQEGEHSYAR